MSPFTKHAKPLVVLCLAIGFVARLVIAVRPTDVLVNRYLADDFFYYLTIAFNVAHGHGSTFDGGITYTNGYNPLLLGLLALAFRLGVTKVAAVHLGLVIEAVAIVVAGWLASVYCLRREAAGAAVLAAAMLSFNPFFIWSTVNGFETGLAVATAFVALELWDRDAAAAWVGIACGVAFLARADALAVAFVLFLACTWRGRWHGAAWWAAGFLIVASPFVIWSHHEFGLLLPGSAVQKVALRSLASVSESMGVVLSTLPNVIISNRVLERLSPPVAWAVAAATALVCLAGIKSLGLTRTFILLGMLTAYVPVADGHEVGALKRYLFPVWALSLISLALAIDKRERPTDRTRRMASLQPVLTGAVISLVLFVELSDCIALLRWDRATPPVAAYVGACGNIAPMLDVLVPKDERVASFDSGSLGYFSSRPIVNVDGLVNNDIREVRASCKNGEYRACLMNYFREKNITVLVGGTAFGWTAIFPDWPLWNRLYESPPLTDGARIVVIRIPR